MIKGIIYKGEDREKKQTEKRRRRMLGITLCVSETRKKERKRKQMCSVYA